ncbi:hypothetical protein [Cellulomonas hominis]|uniref:hypothetical protein n=1 Tax=Cellulomonas hominis TaxID=156981 RepID=UPI001B9E6F4E|nr:hypothetical protein [Cellulomonas hominis]VTR77850.1 hypothetical protein CHMI_02622 [Cellulomonas hominis]
MSTRPAPVPQPLVHRAFRTADGAALGLTAGRMRSSDLAAPHRGVRVAGPPAADLEGRCRALLPLLPPGARFTHVTALALVGVEPPWSLKDDDRLHVEVSTTATRPRIRGVVTHRIPGAVPLLHLRGLPVLRPELAWTRTADRLAHTELVVLADGLCRRKRPVTTPERLAQVVATLPAGTRGVRLLRGAAASCGAGTDSVMETRTRLALDSAGIRCEVNRAVRDEQGRFIAMPDLSDPVLRVAIEYDGDVHRTDRRTWQRDVARRQALEAAGWRVVTLTAGDVLGADDRWISWVAAARTAQSRVASRSSRGQ